MSNPIIYNKPTHLVSSNVPQGPVLGEGVLKHWKMDTTRRYHFHVSQLSTKHMPTQHEYSSTVPCSQAHGTSTFHVELHTFHVELHLHYLEVRG